MFKIFFSHIFHPYHSFSSLFSLSLIHYLFSPPESLQKREFLPAVSTKIDISVTLRLGTYCISSLGNTTQEEERILETDIRVRDIPLFPLQEFYKNTSYTTIHVCRGPRSDILRLRLPLQSL